MFLVRTKDSEEVGKKVEFGNNYTEMKIKEAKESDKLQVEYGNDYMDVESGASKESFCPKRYNKKDHYSYRCREGCPCQDCKTMDGSYISVGKRGCTYLQNKTCWDESLHLRNETYSNRKSYTDLEIQCGIPRNCKCRCLPYKPYHESRMEHMVWESMVLPLVWEDCEETEGCNSGLEQWHGKLKKAGKVELIEVTHPPCVDGCGPCRKCKDGEDSWVNLGETFRKFQIEN